MTIEIKDRSGRVLFTSSHSSVKAAVEEARASRANLHGANLHGADLSHADLSHANLYRADLSGADLYGANLHGADLSGADLYGANLHGANLHGANLHGADLSGANLHGADLYRANLYRANLSGANLSRADLSHAENSALAAAQTSITPAGSITGWKKCRNNVIVELKIPAKAKRSNATGRKCRAEYAKVIAVHGGDIGQSQHDLGFTYRAGEIVRPIEPFDDNRWNECASGIHFYLTREEAEADW